MFPLFSRDLADHGSVTIKLNNAANALDCAEQSSAGGDSQSFALRNPAIQKHPIPPHNTTTPAREARTD
jgi:hypothetical protein